MKQYSIKFMRRLNPQSLRQIQEKVRQHPDLKEFL